VFEEPGVLLDPRIAEFALFLAIVAAFSELIPLFGPWLAAIPAVLYGLTLGPASLIAIIALYVLISFVEGNVLVPAIEGRSFALRPAVVGPVITIGLALGGAFGAVLAVPAASAARDIYLYLFRRASGMPRPRVEAARPSDVGLGPRRWQRAVPLDRPLRGPRPSSRGKRTSRHRPGPSGEMDGAGISGRPRARAAPGRPAGAGR
jgi:hypothetical protein